MLNTELGGATEAALTALILEKLGYTPERAVLEIANKLGVNLQLDTISNGSHVETEAGEAQASILTETDVAKLVAARDVLNRVLP